MKTILVLRHAKSSWSNPNLSDHDRPLKKRGRVDAPKIGRLLVDQYLIPELILSSSAKRALATAKMVADFAEYEGEIVVSRDLYHADSEIYMEALREVPKWVSSVMIVGHNPGLEEFVEELGGVYVRMPTATLVQIAVPISSWSAADLEIEGKVVNVWRPREL